jgi:hypothetical protein
MNLRKWYDFQKPIETQPVQPVRARIPKRKSRFLPPWEVRPVKPAYLPAEAAVRAVDLPEVDDY